MARRTKIYTVIDPGRDRGKKFFLTEMPASQAERWALRAFLALAKSKKDVGDISSQGMAGLAQVGLDTFFQLDYYEIEPLLDEMKACIKYIPNPENIEVIRPLLEDDIEEVATWLTLRMEVFALHTDFSLAVAKPNQTSR